MFDRTGEDDVDTLLVDLEGIDPEGDLTDHVSTLERVHDTLQRRLAATDG